MLLIWRRHATAAESEAVRIRNKADAIEAARNFLSTTWIDEEHCIQGIRCHYRKPKAASAWAA